VGRIIECGKNKSRTPSAETNVRYDPPAGVSHAMWEDRGRSSVPAHVEISRIITESRYNHEQTKIK
jgi:hypothetical protein